MSATNEGAYNTPMQNNQTMSATNEDSGEVVPHCWICHDEGTDELGDPLRRDCSCRGLDSGYAHLSCLVGYAKHQTKQWNGRNFHKLRKLWSDCPCCEQRHQDQLRVDIAVEFVFFMETNYSDDQGKQIMALYEKLESLTYRGYLKRCPPQAIQKSKDIANKILSLIKQVKAEECPLLKRDKYIEPFTYHCLGIIAMKEGTKNSAQEALAHFEKCRDLCILLGPTATLAMVGCNITIAKDKCGEVISIERKLEQSQKVYDMRLKKQGEGAIDTLISGKNLAWDLLEACRLVEAERLLVKLAAVSKQVHGSDHSLTKEIHSVQRRLRKQQSERRAILPTIVSVFLLCWHLVVIFLSVLTIILSGLTIILCFGTSTLRTVRDVLVRVHGSDHSVTKSIRSEQRNKQLNQALVLSIILSSILSMYKISYGVSAVLSGGVVSLYYKL